MYKSLFLFWLLIGMITPAALAQINTRLQNGTPIIIDENSRNVYVIEGNTRRPLWGGVHRLESGASVTINSGVLINEFQSSAVPGLRQEIFGESSQCELLVAQVCGQNNQCAPYAGCNAARQLLKMEEQERAPGDLPSIITPSSNSCSEALRDAAYFVPCLAH